MFELEEETCGVPARTVGRRARLFATWGTALALAVGFFPPAATAGEDDLAENGHYCSATAQAMRDACRHDAESEFRIAVGRCLNLSDEAARAECETDARDSRKEALQLCRDQHAARLEACDALGEARYDPSFDPSAFDTDFTQLTNPNPYFPLAIGNQWVYGGNESVTVEVLDKTKLIEGVTCIVVNDRVSVDGEVVEDTNDWFAQAKSGDVSYAGEEVKEYETFGGDVPKEPELVSIEGSFKTGRDGAKPGIAFLAAPTPGHVYRQEFSLGSAEDLAKILSTTYAYGADPQLDLFVPQELAELLCAGDCIVVEEFTPLDPGAAGVERKYYAQGIGFFLEVAPESGDVNQLVSCNFDARCAELPPLE